MKQHWNRCERTVVVDFHRGCIRLALAETAGEAVRFRGITQIPFPRDKTGAVAHDQIAELIGEEVKQRGWTGMPAGCLLSKSSTSTQSFLFPPMSDAELRGAIELKLSETLHFDVEQAYFDYRRIRQYESNGKTQVLVLVVAALQEAVNNGVEVLRKAGLRPKAMGASSESLANLTYYASLCKEGEATIHADIGSDSTIVNLFEGRLLRFSREVDIAGEEFTRALMRPIITEAGAIQLTREQAEEVKTTAGYPLESGESDESMDSSGAEEDPELLHGVRASEILPLLEPVAQRLSTELRRSMDYLRGILGSTSIDRIVLSGTAASMQNLDKVLEENLETPVVRIDPVARAMAHWRLAICDEDAPSTAGFAAILGYSLGNHRPINLLPREVHTEQTLQHVSAIRKVVTPGAMALAVCLALVAVPIHGTYGSADELMQSTSDTMGLRLQSEAAMAAELEAAGQAANAVGTARGPVPLWSGVLKELAVILPAEIQLVSLNCLREESKSVLRLRAQVHSGAVPSEVVHLQATDALSDSPFFDNLRVHSATVANGDSPGEFEATVDLITEARAPEWKTP